MYLITTFDSSETQDPQDEGYEYRWVNPRAALGGLHFTDIANNEMSELVNEDRL